MALKIVISGGFGVALPAHLPVINVDARDRQSLAAPLLVGS